MANDSKCFFMGLNVVNSLFLLFIVRFYVQLIRAIACGTHCRGTACTRKQQPECMVRKLLSNGLLYLAINFAGMYTKYLTDRGQRLAFMETHKAMELKKDSEKEYQRTQKLLDSSECYIRVRLAVCGSFCAALYRCAVQRGRMENENS